MPWGRAGGSARPGVVLSAQFPCWCWLRWVQQEPHVARAPSCPQSTVPMLGGWQPPGISMFLGNGCSSAKWAGQGWAGPGWHHVLWGGG